MINYKHPNMRVAMIEPVGGHSGMDYYDFGLCDGLTKQGLEVTLYTCNETDSWKDDSFRIKRFYNKIYGPDPAWIRGLRYLSGTLQSLWHAAQIRSKVVHFHLFYVTLLEFFNIFLARVLGFKVVITAHDVKPFVDKLSAPRLARIAYQLAHVVIGHNHISQTEINSFLHVPIEKIKCIPHGNYLLFIRPQDSLSARKNLHIAASKKVILFFGQIKETKGLDLLLQALPQVIQEHPDIALVIAGRPWKDDFSKYQALIDAYNLNAYCQLHIRHIPDNEVDQFYSAASLVVLPYRQIYQSGVLLMAMSYAKPVLVSDLAGLKEVVTDNETGFIFKSLDPDSLAKKMRTIFSQAEHTMEVGENGFRLMATEYSWTRIGKLTLECYKAILR